MLGKIHSNIQLSTLEKGSLPVGDLLIKDKTLSETVYDRLCEVIAGMRPGRNRLPSEDELARSMGVSRATIREALKRLQMDGIITTLHGKGTYAHPSVFGAEGRLDRFSDFGMMLSRRYLEVEVVNECGGYRVPGALYRRYFPNAAQIFSYGWTYRADRRPMLHCDFEICPDFIVREVDPGADVASLPQFSEHYMLAAIDYCIMAPRIRTCPEASRALELPDAPPMLCWEERIFDIEDHLVATGVVYVHPENMELSVVTRFEI